MSKTHRKRAQALPLLDVLTPNHLPHRQSREPSRRERMRAALANQEQESRGALEFPEPEVVPPRPDW